MIFATNWTTAWLMTGLGLGVVFSILVLLVLVLQIFSAVAEKGSAAPAKKAAVASKAAEGPLAEDASDRRAVAIATALYLHMENAHDEESGVLTIHMDEHPAWHAQLNASL